MDEPKDEVATVPTQEKGAALHLNERELESKELVPPEQTQGVKIVPTNASTKHAAQSKKKSRQCDFAFYYEKDKEGNKKIAIRSTENKSDTLQELAGTPNKELANSIIEHAVKAMWGGLESVENLNMILQTLADLRPRDSTEARLITQATVLYARGMHYFKMAENSIDRLEDADMFSKKGLIECHHSQTKFAMKFLQMHNETVEALSRLRRGNEQKILVQHQNMQFNGPAIVGNSLNGGGGQQPNIGEVPYGYDTNM